MGVDLTSSQSQDASCKRTWLSARVWQSCLTSLPELLKSSAFAAGAQLEKHVLENSDCRPGVAL